jgi:hypothetical protein
MVDYHAYKGFVAGQIRPATYKTAVPLLPAFL